MRGNPEVGKRAGGRETVDESPDRGEENFRARFERKEKGERESEKKEIEEKEQEKR